MKQQQVKFKLDEVLQDSPNYLQQQSLQRLKDDLTHPGGDFRHASMRALLSLLEQVLQRLGRLEEAVTGLGERMTGLEEELHRGQGNGKKPN